MDLPDELQLKIVAHAIASSPMRYCAIQEPSILTNDDLLNKRRNPLKLFTYSSRIELAEVNHKFRAIVLELYPQCFTITKDGKRVVVPIRFNLSNDRLSVPQVSSSWGQKLGDRLTCRGMIYWSPSHL